MASDFRESPASRAHRVVCVEATERLCGSHTGGLCVEATRGPLLCRNSILWLLRSQDSCVGCICCLKKLYMSVKQARILPENIESGTNWVGKAPFGLKLSAVRAVPLRMPPACLDCQKKPKIRKKNIGFGDFRAPGPPGPISALFPGVGRALRGFGFFSPGFGFVSTGFVSPSSAPAWLILTQCRRNYLA